MHTARAKGLGTLLQQAAVGRQAVLAPPRCPGRPGRPRGEFRAPGAMCVHKLCHWRQVSRGDPRRCAAWRPPSALIVGPLSPTTGCGVVSSYTHSAARVGACYPLPPHQPPTPDTTEPKSAGAEPHAPLPARGGSGWHFPPTKLARSGLRAPFPNLPPRATLSGRGSTGADGNACGR